MHTGGVGEGGKQKHFRKIQKLFNKNKIKQTIGHPQRHFHNFTAPQLWILVKKHQGTHSLDFQSVSLFMPKSCFTKYGTVIIWKKSNKFCHFKGKKRRFFLSFSNKKKMDKKFRYLVRRCRHNPFCKTKKWAENSSLLCCENVQTKSFDKSFKII